MDEVTVLSEKSIMEMNIVKGTTTLDIEKHLILQDWHRRVEMGLGMNGWGMDDCVGELGVERETASPSCF